MKKWLSVLLLLLVLSACKTRKNAAAISSDQDSVAIKNDKTQDAGKGIYDRLGFYEKIYIHPKFDHIKIYSKITADNLRVSPLDATIYIETDKKIWSNITFLFFNAARALITPEGIKAIDRYNKNYIDSDFDYLNNLLNTNFIDYKSLEKLLLGRTFLKINNKNSDITKNENGYTVKSIANQKIETDGKVREYKLELKYNNDFNLTKAKLQDAKSDDAVEIVYDNWTTVEQNIRLPLNVKIIIKGSKQSQILLENTKFDFSKMETPYNVPSSYQKLEIK